MKPDELIVQIAGVVELKEEVSKLRQAVDALILEMQRSRRSPEESEQRYLSLREMKTYTGLSPNTILKYFTPAKLGGKLLFDTLAVDAILKSYRSRTAEDETQNFKNRIDTLASKAS
jgi:predicted DNA-binding transcriptional regulator AlpA